MIKGFLSRHVIDRDATAPRWWTDYMLANQGNQKFALENQHIKTALGADVPYMPPGSSISVGDKPSLAGKIGTVLLAGALGATGTALLAPMLTKGESAEKSYKAKLIDNVTGKTVWSGDLPQSGQISIPVDNGLQGNSGSTP